MVAPAVVPRLVAFWTRILPALTVVTPVYVLAALSVSVPIPDLVRVPVVVAMTPPTVVLPEPVTVRFWAVALMPAVVSVPASDATVAPPAPRVIAPDQVLALARLRMAPVAVIPVPMRLVIGSAIVRPVPSTLIAAPEATVVAPAVVPRLVAFWTLTTPALIVVRPVYVLAALKVSVPVPDLVSAPAPAAIPP